MSDVWLGRTNRWIEKLFNVKGGPTVVDIDPSLRVVVPLDGAVEERFHQGWNRFANAVNTSAAAGANAAAQIRNPSGSNVVAVLESALVIQFGVATRSQVTLGNLASTVDLTTITPNIRLDARIGGQNSSLVVSATSNVGAANVFKIGAITGTPFEFILYENQEFPILPGDLYRIQNNTVNEQLTVSFTWRERALENSELT